MATGNVVGMDGGKDDRTREVQVRVKYENETARHVNFKGKDLVFTFSPMESFLVIAQPGEEDMTDNLIASFPLHVVESVRDTTEEYVKSEG